MGLLLSILVVCVGVLEAVSCFRHIQDGYVPFWMPRRVLPIAVERVGRKPSIHHDDDVSSSSEEEISNILVNPVINVNARQEGHGYGLTPILTEHRRNTPILFDEEGGAETITYVENNIDECYSSSRRSSHDASNHVVTEHFRPISPSEPEEEVLGSSPEEARELGATPATVVVEQRCVSDESSETLSEFDADNPQETVLTYDDVQNNNQIGFRPSAPEKSNNIQAGDIETICNSLQDIAVQPNHITASQDQQSELCNRIGTSKDQCPDNVASSTSEHDHIEETEDCKALSNSAPELHRGPPAPLLIDTPVASGSARPGTPSTPRKVKADISWPVFHPDAPVIKRPAVSSDIATRLGLARGESLDEDLILDYEGDDVDDTTAEVDNLTQIPEEQQNNRQPLVLQPTDDEYLSSPKPLAHSFSLEQSDSDVQLFPSLPSKETSPPNYAAQENLLITSTSAETSNLSDTLPLFSTIPSNCHLPSVQIDNASHPDNDTIVFPSETTRRETITAISINPVAITLDAVKLEIDLPSSGDLVNEPDDVKVADIPDDASPRVTVSETDINIIENYFTTAPSPDDVHTTESSVASTTNNESKATRKTSQKIKDRPHTATWDDDKQRPVSLKEILQPELKEDSSVFAVIENKPASVKANIDIFSSESPAQVSSTDGKLSPMEPSNKITSDSVTTVDNAPEHVMKPTISVDPDEDIAEDSSESVSLGRDITSKESSIKRRKSYREKKRSVTPKTSTESIAEGSVPNGVVKSLQLQVDSSESTSMKGADEVGAKLSGNSCTSARISVVDASSNKSSTLGMQSDGDDDVKGNIGNVIQDCRESDVVINDKRTLNNDEGKVGDVVPALNDYDDDYMPDVVVHRRESAAEAILNKAILPVEVLHGSETNTEAAVYATKSHQERLQKRARAESVEEAPAPGRNTQVDAGVAGSARRTNDNETKPHDDDDEEQSSVDDSESLSTKQPVQAAFWLIFSGEYTKAMSKDWHSGHFCCWQCDESLTGQRYVLRDDHPYCIKCYESVFANMCEECNKTIGIDSKDLSYKDKHWHEACFLCNKCRVSLVDKQFGSKADKIYCGNCYDSQFASRCDGCGEIFRAGTKKMEYKTRQWHEKCFCCCVCKSAIGTKSFIPREQEIYCATCYEEKFATRCVKCNKIITSGGVTYKNEPWHRECFTCTHCSTSLAGQRFTSRDEKPYCAECFGELFAKRCTACVKPITGIGGTRFISFEDRHWHNDCFICASCKTSLVGRGFITDADDIICPECAKQKLM